MAKSCQDTVSPTKAIDEVWSNRRGIDGNIYKFDKGLFWTFFVLNDGVRGWLVPWPSFGKWTVDAVSSVESTILLHLLRIVKLFN